MLMFVIYDGISNSVFEGQVLQPLIKKLETGLTNKVVIVSFEKVQPPPHVVHALTTKHPNLSVITLKKYPFLGKLSLLPAVRSLRTILEQHTDFNVIARGPLAGWICIQALKKNRKPTLTVQARGLLAEEYKFLTKNERSIIKRLVYRLKVKKFTSLEKSVFSRDEIIIEAVTPALKNFLITNYGAHEKNIIIAQHDLPAKIEPATIASWRSAVRTELGIDHGTYVYCFNGSAKPWQCAPDIVSFFEQQYAHNHTLFLLLLSQDKQAFRSLLAATKLPDSAYAIVHVPHHDVYRYLAACDAGLVLRKPSLVNWVSRPTKVLEYEAVGLTVVHNNTVAWLVEKNRNQKHAFTNP
jgi:hypothetical protein